MNQLASLQPTKLIKSKESILSFTFTATNGKWNDETLWQPYFPGLTITKNQTIHIEGNCEVTEDIECMGNINISKSATLSIKSGILTNKARINNYGSLIIRPFAKFINLAKAKLSHSGQTVQISGKLLNDGLISFSKNRLFHIKGKGLVINAGIIN